MSHRALERTSWHGFVFRLPEPGGGDLWWMRAEKPPEWYLLELPGDPAKAAPLENRMAGAGAARQRLRVEGYLKVGNYNGSDVIEVIDVTAESGSAKNS